MSKVKIVRKPTYEDLLEILEIWNKTANRLNVILVAFGIATIVTSVLVSVYTGTKFMDDDTIKVLAFTSTASLTLLTAFNIVKKSNNARKAWRILNSAIYKYDQGIYTMKDLITAYEIGEDIVGDVDFSFSSVVGVHAAGSCQAITNNSISTNITHKNA